MFRILKLLNIKNHKTLNNTLEETFKSSHQNFWDLFGQNIKGKNTFWKHYLGPGTCFDIQLNENNIPKSGEEPINAINYLAYIYDLAYLKILII